MTTIGYTTYKLEPPDRTSWVRWTMV